MRTYIPVMIPMMVTALRMSENLAVAMLNRGYGATSRATPMRETKARPIDYVISVGLALVILVGFAMARMGFGAL